MKTVYVVLKGEVHEGSSLTSVHYTLKGATKFALATEAVFGDHLWEPDKEDSNYWTNGCDFVEIVKMKVEE